jgi:FAD/FMN-containing dehydrogenase
MGLERNSLRLLFGPVRDTKFVAEAQSSAVRVSNWNTEHSCLPASVSAPSTVAELAEIVRMAVARGQSVRAVGSLHSLSAAPMVAGDGVIVSTERLNKIGLIEGETATFQAGVTLRQACQALKPMGKQLIALPLTDQFHLGAISGTQFHDAMAFNSDVVQIKYVASDGSLRVVADEADLFYWRSSHGLFGVTYEITVRRNRPLTVDV